MRISTERKTPELKRETRMGEAEEGWGEPMDGKTDRNADTRMEG